MHQLWHVCCCSYVFCSALSWEYTAGNPFYYFRFYRFSLTKWKNGLYISQCVCVRACVQVPAMGSRQHGAPFNSKWSHHQNSMSNCGWRQSTRWGEKTVHHYLCSKYDCYMMSEKFGGKNYIWCNFFSFVFFIYRTDICSFYLQSCLKTAQNRC